MSNQKEFLSTGESNLQYNNIRDNIILLSNDSIILKNERLKELEIFSKYESILSSKKTIAVFKYFLKNGCATAYDVQINLSLSEQTAYRVVKRLREEKLIFPLFPLKKHNKVGGPPPTLYGVSGYDQTDVDNAVSRSLRICTPIYEFVDILVQKTLPEIIDTEIQFKKLIFLAKKMGGHGFPFVDLANESAKVLQSQGIKIYK